MRGYLMQGGIGWIPIATRRYFKSLTFTSNSSFVVPQGTKQIWVDCVGAQGYTYSSGIGGNGGRVQCLLKTTPGQTLYIVVGQALTSLAPAYNASDIRTANGDLSSRLVVAGGGGSGSYVSWTYTTFANGGAGGGTVGANGGVGSNSYYTASGGGTQSSGGTAGYAASAYGYQNYGVAGGFGNGGSGGTGTAGSGGAGWYGGGGGAASAFASQDGNWRTAVGGAGGSSYTHPSLCTGIVHTQGYRNGNGYISLSYEVGEGESYDYYRDETLTQIFKDKGK